ncbi:hypothetical protein G9F71_025635 [Clostridium sp. FP2]|uniref:hypothetical protein n=1 Tax=Clostridium sp. FP2 TaxID=2724481 RepID=UPI0013E92D19|nr:hypothetical protein [Clostridium sp. FP2]MBZ9626190.1 hypothetical protein [Clostridium sp. FP2]
MNEEKINKKSSAVDKAAFIIRYIFFGFLIWSYYSAILTIGRKGAIGVVIGFIALAMFFIFKEGINPIKMNHKEFGKYTDIIGILISIIFMLCCLAPLLGIGFYK